MNADMNTENTLQTLAQQLQQQLPQYHITRSYREFSQHPAEQLQQGVITLLWNGLNQFDLGREDASLNLLIIGHLQLPNAATYNDAEQGLQVEQAELAMYQALEHVLHGRGENVPCTGLEIESVTNSKQLERPYGWVALQVSQRHYDIVR